MTIESRTFCSDTQRPLKRDAASLLCAEEQSALAKPPLEGGVSSGVCVWLGASLSFAQSSYQFRIQMTSSFSVASSGQLLSSELGGERWQLGGPSSQMLLVGWEGGNKADTCATKERVLLSWTEAPDTG